MNLKRLFAYLLIWTPVASVCAEEDYKQDPEFLALRDSMTYAFNNADSARFYPYMAKLEDYLLEKNDLHAYYTQRCNEIVFLMNRQKIFEAYKLSKQLSQELREKKLENETYMAYNMLGHIYRYCGDKEEAKRCFYEVLRRLEQAGYYESMPAIYMNLVNVEMVDHPEKAIELLNKARDIAAVHAPERVFGIETRRTMAYYSQGDTGKFLEGYEAYKQGVAEGKSSVYGNELDVYYLALQGKVDEAVELARKEMGESGYGAIVEIYKNAGRWKEALEAFEHQMKTESEQSARILSSNMQGIRDELRVYDAERKAARNKFITLVVTMILLSLLVAALFYIAFSRRRHIRQLQNAYQHALESDRMKLAFIQNISHEVRTPLNIISGFSQVLANPDLGYDQEERNHMAKMIQEKTNDITALIDELLGLSRGETMESVSMDDKVKVNELMKNLLAEEGKNAAQGVETRYESSLPDDFTIQTNATMLRSIVNAVLSNAVKYTEKGSITLKTNSSEQQLVLAVEDTGCGIPASEAEHIFERFVKLDTFKVGIGLGLALSRVAAQHLGGTVSLDTSYTGGARFVVTLPLLNTENT